MKTILYIQYAAKATVAGVTAFSGTLTVALGDGQVTSGEWVGVASTTVLAVLAVFGITNGAKPKA